MFKKFQGIARLMIPQKSVWGSNRSGASAAPIRRQRVRFLRSRSESRLHITIGDPLFKGRQGKQKLVRRLGDRKYAWLYNARRRRNTRMVSVVSVNKSAEAFGLRACRGLCCSLFCCAMGFVHRGGFTLTGEGLPSPSPPCRLWLGWLLAPWRLSVGPGEPWKIPNRRNFNLFGSLLVHQKNYTSQTRFWRPRAWKHVVLWFLQQKPIFRT